MKNLQNWISENAYIYARIQICIFFPFILESLLNTVFYNGKNLTKMYISKR